MLPSTPRAGCQEVSDTEASRRVEGNDGSILGEGKGGFLIPFIPRSECSLLLHEQGVRMSQIRKHLGEWKGGFLIPFIPRSECSLLLHEQGVRMSQNGARRVEGSDFLLSSSRELLFTLLLRSSNAIGTLFYLR
eukprot:scaffold15462_cov146-Skeletonema_marinoi.AAC.3